VLVEQSAARALEIAESVCVLVSGSAVFFGPAAIARADKALFESFLSSRPQDPMAQQERR
jgi:ABC-type branched-subunit amino acid transport system ATPase component